MKIKEELEEKSKFHSQAAIVIATYIGGPLAAGYLIKKNYDTLGQHENAKKSLIIGVISMVLLVVSIFSVPEHIMSKIPNAIIPLAYTGIILLIVEKIQGAKLKEHKESGGEFHSRWKAAGAGVASLLVIALTGFIAGDLSNVFVDYDTKTYKDEMENFIKNEELTLAAFEKVETESAANLEVEFTQGVALWQKNKDILYKIGSIANLPTELTNKNKQLLKYCDLRIEQYKIILKMISKDSNELSSELERINLKIKQVLEPHKKP